MKAAKAGYLRAKSRTDFLEENNITKGDDWFMEKGDELTPEGECYSWVKRSIKRKD